MYRAEAFHKWLIIVVVIGGILCAAQGTVSAGTAVNVWSIRKLQPSRPIPVVDKNQKLSEANTAFEKARRRLLNSTEKEAKKLPQHRVNPKETRLRTKHNHDATHPKQAVRKVPEVQVEEDAIPGYSNCRRPIPRPHKLRHQQWIHSNFTILTIRNNDYPPSNQNH